jgi:C4-dicarboxylate-specific signal transduction histidine kinase/CheY-like chemotaxis protein
MQQPEPAQAAKILIVDDSPTQAKLLEQVLKTEGYQVSVSHNGAEALKHILANAPDLVISDILMPKMDGFELCRRMRAIEALKCLPIILLTHLNDPSDVLHSLEAGADYFISKPYNDRLLLSRISSTLERKGACYEEDVDGKITLSYRGQSYAINAPKAQIIDLLLATYELAAEKNQELLSAKLALSQLNQELEQRVRERTAALVVETAERVQAVEELRKKDEILMQQSRQAALGEMIGNIAHQWRQPLNAVGLLVQDIALCYEYDNFSKDYLDSSTKKIMKLVRHMSQTIDDFRNFFTPEKEKVEFDLGKTVAKNLALVEGSLTDKGIRIQLSAQDAPILFGYPNEFAQVLLNILNNARDAFSGQQVDDPFVSVRVCTENGRAVVTIADNAGGIDADVINRIFEPYFTTKEQGKGTGIGLYMSKNIVEKNMNGSLTVRNTALGAEFRIEV